MTNFLVKMYLDNRWFWFWCMKMYSEGKLSKPNIKLYTHDTSAVLFLFWIYFLTKFDHWPTNPLCNVRVTWKEFSSWEIWNVPLVPCAAYSWREATCSDMTSVARYKPNRLVTVRDAFNIIHSTRLAVNMIQYTRLLPFLQHSPLRCDMI